MPVLPALSSSLPCAVTRESFQTFDEPGLSWESILAFTAILFGVVQATLMMESAAPCRPSCCKIITYLVLEFLELVVAILAEGFSFRELRSAFQVRLQWLSWLPYCLLVYGLVEILCEVVYEVYLAYRSRVEWIPFSSVDQGENYLSCILTIVGLSVSAGLSLVLVGWRKRWWMKTSSPLSAEEGIASASGEVFLSVGVMTFCIAWALVLQVFLGTLCLLCRKELCIAAYFLGFITKSRDRLRQMAKDVLTPSKKKQPSCPAPGSADGDGCFQIFKKILRPSQDECFSAAETTEAERNQISDQWRLLVLLKKAAVIEDWTYSATPKETLNIRLTSRVRETNEPNQTSDRNDKSLCDVDESVISYTKKGPPNVRNAILGIHKKKFTGNEEAKVLEQVLLFARHASLLPLLICVVVAVGRLWNRVDFETLRTLNKLADVVIVISWVEIAMNIKPIIWRIKDHSDSDNDREPDAVNV
ncbi:hypothetical protein FGB62_128g021 [Gracilaria domingensis]|nr:hypothetical protein FGB62_128g021 [Gracilaria domingensis]